MEVVSEKAMEASSVCEAAATGQAEAAPTPASAAAAAAAGAAPEKWFGGVQLVIDAEISRAWEVSSNAEGLPLWMPMIDSCEMVDSCRRRIRGEILPRMMMTMQADDGGLQQKQEQQQEQELEELELELEELEQEQEQEQGSWAIERLEEMDEEHHFYAYSVEESNMGLDGYAATFQLHDFGDGSTLVSWFYELNPIPDSSQEAIADYMSLFFKACIKKLELVCRNQA